MATSNIVVKELIIYPVKSCAGIKVNEAQATRYGLSLSTDPLLSDRRWIIVKNGRPQTQRQLSRMALIRPSFNGTDLTLDAPGMSTLAVSTNPLPEHIIDYGGMKGRVHGDDVSQWLSTFLETPDLKLVYFDEQFEPRHVKGLEPQYPNEAHDSDVITYQDMSPFLLCSLASIDDLNTRLTNPVKIYNFRPNIIVDGVDGPYVEDYWREIQIGDVVKLRWFRSCLRCLLPTVDQETGIRDPAQEPWNTLRSYRLKPNLYDVKSQFGIYLAPDANGLIRVGDRVDILREDRNF